MPDLEALYEEAHATVDRFHALDQAYQTLGNQQMDLLTALFQSQAPIPAQTQDLVRTFVDQLDLDTRLYFRLGYEAAQQKGRVP